MKLSIKEQQAIKLVSDAVENLRAAIQKYVPDQQYADRILQRIDHIEHDYRRMVATSSAKPAQVTIIDRQTGKEITLENEMLILAKLYINDREEYDLRAEQLRSLLSHAGSDSLLAKLWGPNAEKVLLPIEKGELIRQDEQYIQ